jgi:6-phosphogluconate dehydrogenase (decarboxylating)
MFSNPSLPRVTANHAVNGLAMVCIFGISVSQNTDRDTEGSGHYVKMVHNGIEYGDMQLISEVSLEASMKGDLVLTVAAGIRHHEAWIRPL